ncbi:MAG: hypothetical protein KKA32_00415 [Actinobacteria bacterium]|nr:hypothetical protein [Actinomycetota bacterium]
MSRTAGKIGVVGVVVILAAISTYVMYLLEWTVRGSDTAQGLLGLDICLWVIFWTLCLTGYWGLPADKVPVVRKSVGTVVILALGLAFTYVFKAITPAIVGGTVSGVVSEAYPLMSLTYIAWSLVFVMTALWVGSFYSKL